MAATSEDALEVLRGVWNGQGQTAAEIEEECDGGNRKLCRNASQMGFEGFAEDGMDVRTAWKTRLEREGKLTKSGGSLRDLILGPDEEI